MQKKNYHKFMIIYAATGNEHKRQELSQLFAPNTIVIPKDKGIDFDPEENGNTFVDNTIIKAKALFDIVNQPVIADDSGICVDILDGKPGIYSARYVGNNTFSEKKISDSERNVLLLEEAKKVALEKGIAPDTPLSCRFVCAMVLYLGKDRYYIAQETIEGFLVKDIESAKGSGGFGYDPIDYLPEYGKTIAELSSEEKNAISHRGKAAKVLQKIIQGAERL